MRTRQRPEATAGAPAASSRRARNPVLPGCHPDPSVCRVGGTYVLATSTFGWWPGLPIHTSTDLRTWRLAGHAIERGSQLELAGLGVGDGLYAPGLRHDGRRFLLSCTVVDRARQRFRNFIVTAEDPAGPWSEPVWMPDGFGRIDPTPFIDDDGRVYVALNDLPQPRTPEGGDRVIRLWELDRDELRPIAGPWTLWDGALKRAATPEAPRIWRRGDWYWLLIAEGGTGRNHAVTMARARSLQGPWEPCPANPLLTHRHLGRQAPIQCVGHADLVQAADGSWWALVLATRPRGGAAILGREVMLVPVDWPGDDWPVFAPGSGLVPAALAGPPDSGAPRRAAAPLPWLGLRGPAPARAIRSGIALSARALTCTAPTGVPALAARRLMAPQGSFAAVVEADAGVRAGLVLIADDANQVRLELVGGAASLIEVRAGVERVVATAPGAGRLALSWGAAGIVAAADDRPLGPTLAIDVLARAHFTGAAVGCMAIGDAGEARFRAIAARGVER